MRSSCRRSAFRRTTGVIVSWHKSAGDPVRRGDLLMEVETDKAVVEIEADAEGILSRILAGEGR